MRLQDVRRQLGCLVRWQKAEYRFTACILRKAGELWSYSAELQDVKANSVMIVPLEEVQEV